MKEDIQNTIEDYLLGNLSEADKTAFEKLLDTDSEILEALEKTKIVKEALLRSQVRESVNKARIETAKTDTTGLQFFRIIGTFAAAASIFLVLISTPISLKSIEFNTRGAKDDYSNEAISKLTTDFEVAQKNVIENRNLSQTIVLLNNIKSDTLVSDAYQLQSKWLLVNAYLKNGDAINAEKTFVSINCTDNCPYSAWDKLKIQWQIFWNKLL